MKLEEIVEFLSENRGYLKKSKGYVASKLQVDINLVYRAFGIVKHNINIKGKITPIIVSTAEQEEYNEFLKWRSSKNKVEISSINKNLPKPYLKGDKNNVLIIGDLHAPFILDGYLEFCREQQEKYNCGTIIFIGDLIDGNSFSYHEHDPDGIGQAEEIDRSKLMLSDWFKVFPIAKVTLGNHDLLIQRKMRTIGLSNKFMKDFGDIWGAPKEWEFGYEFLINGVKYIHGNQGNAIKIARDSRISTVQGHLHSQAFIEYSVSDKDKLFGLQVGCGIDHKAYAFDYSKPFPKKPIIGCAVVLEGGKLPINILMDL